MKSFFERSDTEMVIVGAYDEDVVHRGPYRIERVLDRRRCVPPVTLVSRHALFWHDDRLLPVDRQERCPGVVRILVDSEHPLLAHGGRERAEGRGVSKRGGRA